MIPPRKGGVVAITAGDPCGIGPEVVVKALSTFRARPRFPIVLIGDAPVIARAEATVRRRVPAWVQLIDCGHRRALRPGRTSAAAGAASLAYLQQALSRWRTGQVRALVTAPVTKWAVARVQTGFVGHTEYLANAMRVRRVAMMFVSDRLRVVVMTRHIPLREVSRAVTRAALRQTLQLTDTSLRNLFGISRPRLAVCGLNPHAGEGDPRSEEHRVIKPVLHALKQLKRRIRCEGPFAADGFFAQADRIRSYDAILCAYHDQGLIPFKTAARDQGCQLTLGLPIVRTSPDHGSALDIAGQGIADPGSMIYAIRLALQLASRTDSRVPWRHPARPRRGAAYRAPSAPGA